MNVVAPSIHWHLPPATNFTRTANATCAWAHACSDSQVPVGARFTEANTSLASEIDLLCCEAVFVQANVSAACTPACANGGTCVDGACVCTGCWTGDACDEAPDCGPCAHCDPGVGCVQACSDSEVCRDGACETCESGVARANECVCAGDAVSCALIDAPLGLSCTACTEPNTECRNNTCVCAHGWKRIGLDDTGLCLDAVCDPCHAYDAALGRCVWVCPSLFDECVADAPVLVNVVNATWTSNLGLRPVYWLTLPNTTARWTLVEFDAWGANNIITWLNNITSNTGSYWAAFVGWSNSRAGYSADGGATLTSSDVLAAITARDTDAFAPYWLLIDREMRRVTMGLLDRYPRTEYALQFEMSFVPTFLGLSGSTDTIQYRNVDTRSLGSVPAADTDTEGPYVWTGGSNQEDSFAANVSLPASGRWLLVEWQAQTTTDVIALLADTDGGWLTPDTTIVDFNGFDDTLFFAGNMSQWNAHGIDGMPLKVSTTSVPIPDADEAQHYWMLIDRTLLVAHTGQYDVFPVSHNQQRVPLATQPMLLLLLGAGADVTYTDVRITPMPDDLYLHTNASMPVNDTMLPAFFGLRESCTPCTVSPPTIPEARWTGVAPFSHVPAAAVAFPEGRFVLVEFEAVGEHDIIVGVGETNETNTYNNGPSTMVIYNGWYSAPSIAYFNLRPEGRGSPSELAVDGDQQVEVPGKLTRRSYWLLFDREPGGATGAVAITGQYDSYPHGQNLRRFNLNNHANYFALFGYSAPIVYTNVTARAVTLSEGSLPVSVDKDAGTLADATVVFAEMQCTNCTRGNECGALPDGRCRVCDWEAGFTCQGLECVCDVTRCYESDGGSGCQLSFDEDGGCQRCVDGNVEWTLCDYSTQVCNGGVCTTCASKPESHSTCACEPRDCKTCDDSVARNLHGGCDDDQVCNGNVCTTCVGNQVVNGDQCTACPPKSWPSNRAEGTCACINDFASEGSCGSPAFPVTKHVDCTQPQSAKYTSHDFVFCSGDTPEGSTATPVSGEDNTCLCQCGHAPVKACVFPYCTPEGAAENSCNGIYTFLANDDKWLNVFHGVGIPPSGGPMLILPEYPSGFSRPTWALGSGQPKYVWACMNDGNDANFGATVTYDQTGYPPNAPGCVFGFARRLVYTIDWTDKTHLSCLQGDWTTESGADWITAHGYTLPDPAPVSGAAPAYADIEPPHAGCGNGEGTITTTDVD